MVSFFTLLLIGYTRGTAANHNQVFTTQQKRSIVNNFVQNKWSPNVRSAWNRPKKNSDFALQILSRRSNNNAVSREDFIKQLIKIEGLDEGHFTAAQGVEELVAPTEGLFAVEEELRMAAEEKQKDRRRSWERLSKIRERVSKIQDDDSVTTEVNEHGKAFPAVGNEGVTEHRDDDLEVTVLYDQIHKEISKYRKADGNLKAREDRFLSSGGLIGLASLIPSKTFYLGIMFVWGMLICLVITALKLRKNLFSHPAIEELVDFKSLSGHHKYP